jgi:cytochrome b
MTTSKLLIWDLPVRAFHWLLAASFAGAWFLSESERLRDVHVLLGYAVLTLVGFRLVWGFIGSRHARFASFLYSPREAIAYLRDLPHGGGPRYLGHNPAGSFAVWVILGLAALTGLAGYATYNEIGGEWVAEVHETLANLWLAAVIAHVAGVVISSLAHRENLAAAMVTGYKDAHARARGRGR